LGIEGVSIHGLFIITLLIAIALTAIKGFRNIYEGFNSWTYVTLGLITLTLVIASFSIGVSDVDLIIVLHPFQLE